MPVTRSSMSVSVSEKEAAAALLTLKKGMRGMEIKEKFYEIKNSRQPFAQPSKRPKRECAVYKPGMYAEGDE